MKVAIKQPSTGVTLFEYLPDKLKVGHQFTILNCSDIHIDSKECDRELLKKHCQKADYIKIYGDLFDLMQGKHDKRRSYGDLKDKYKASNYIDEVIKDAVEFFKPFAKKLLFISYGNHETSVINNLGTNPISAFCMLMRMHGAIVIEGSYQGYTIDKIIKPNTNLKTPVKNNIVCAYHHGHGGAPQKTEGVLEMEADKAKFPNADIILKGHNHFKWHNPGQTRYWLNGQFVIEKRVQHHIRLGTYKQSKITDGWEIEKGFKPTPIGGYYISYYLDCFGKEGYSMRFEISDAS